MQESIKQNIAVLSRSFRIVDIIECTYRSVEAAKIDILIKLQKIHKVAYESDERILFVLEHDFVTSSNENVLLDIIQQHLQTVDISNFFVILLSTDPNITTNYQKIHEKISADPVPCTVYAVKGEFEKIPCDQEFFSGRIYDAKKLSAVSEKLSLEQKKRLFEDPVFCMMPWVGINVEPDSSVRPCCWFDRTKPLGNVKNHTLEQIWNSDNWKKLRSDMLSNVAPPECSACYHIECLGRDSARQSINRDFAHRIHDVDNTEYDGHLSIFDLGYLDIRHNNLCNLTCRSCNPKSSSSWYQLHNYLHPERSLDTAFLKINQGDQIIFDEIIKHIDNIERIYIAGGEPLIIENFYRLLEILIDRGKTHVQLLYNTNLTKLELKQWKIIDLWKQFPRISIGASLDAMHDKASYLRSGTNWSEIEENACRIRQDCPHIDFYVSCTVGLINALHVPDFHQNWVELDLIKPMDFNIQLLENPKWMSVRNAPEKLKKQIHHRYQEHLEWLRPLDFMGRATSGFSSVVQLSQSTSLYDQDLFWTNIKQMDSFFKSDLMDTFPELLNVDL